MPEAHLGLPAGIRACLFDLDGVLTKTSDLHAEAWKRVFDSYLRTRAGKTGQPFVPFDAVRDYEEYVDGKPRDEGTRSFLASRSISLLDGGDDDSPGGETIKSLGKRKNELLLQLMRQKGVHVYPGSRRYLTEVRQAGLRTAVVSSSRNCEAVLAAAGIEDMFDERIDGNVAAREHLKGKPAPDTYLRAAEVLGAKPAQAVVYEDALAGVEAGRAGGFGFVVGVDRLGQAEALTRDGADVVVKDLGELLGTT